MSEQLDDYYDEILKVINELQNQFKFIDKTDQKAIVKLDRKARNIETAIREYELDINNNFEQGYDIQQHNKKLLDLKDRYLIIMDQVHQDPTLSKNMTKSTAFKPQSRFNTHSQPSQPQGFVPILQELNGNGYQNSNDGQQQINMGPQDVQIDFNNNIQNPYIQSQIQQPKQISMQPITQTQQQYLNNSQINYQSQPQQQQRQVIMPITHSNVPMNASHIQQQNHQVIQQPQPMQQEVMMTQDFQDYNIQTTEANLQPKDIQSGKINRHMNNILGGNFVGRKCAVRDCFFQTEIQCFKCRVWVCRGHHYQNKNDQKQQNKLQERTKQRYFCRDCGYKKTQEYKGYKWVIACCFCSMIVIAILIALMTYLDFV